MIKGFLGFSFPFGDKDPASETWAPRSRQGAGLSMKGRGLLAAWGPGCGEAHWTCTLHAETQRAALLLRSYQMMYGFYVNTTSLFLVVLKILF